MTSEEFAAMFGALVHMRRAEEDKSVWDLQAAIPGVSASTISRVENGEMPSMEHFLKLMEWLGISESYVLFPERRNLAPLERLYIVLAGDCGLDNDLTQALVKIVRMVMQRSEQ